MTALTVSQAVRRLPTHGDTSSADAKLRAEVVKASCTLEELARHRELLGAEVTEAIIGTVADVRRRLARKELAIVVVGEKKAGKSTFLNAILGARVLGTAVRECTGTVTFIKRAPQALYRATLRNGGVVEFQNLEAAERSKIAHEIESVRQRIGQDSHRIALRRGNGDLEATLAQATTEHAEAARQRMIAEAADGECERHHTAAVSEVQRLIRERDAEQGSLNQLEQRLAAQRVQLHDAEQAFSSTSSELRGHAQRHALALPAVVDAQQRVAATLSLQAAETRVAEATAAVPFFLRPAPWWAFWVFVLRLFTGWFFRARLKVLSEAREQHRFARLVLGTSEALGRVDQSKHDVTETTSRLHAARQSLASAHEHLCGAEGQQATAEQQMKRARAALVETRRAEDVARLKVLHAKSDVLEDAFLARFRSEVHALTDMEKRGQDVVELTIGFPATYLPDGITIIDTPGVNTDNAPNRERAWDVIRREADGCLLVSDLQQVVSRSTRDFLQEVRFILPHILLVMSKVDRALANAEDVGDLEPWQQVEEARRTGVRRFAKEVGRTPEEVFSIAVAAEPALRGDTSPDGLGHRFPSEVAKVFDLLQSERAIVLGARAATALRYCVQRIGEAQAQAEAKYHQRIAELEQQRLPDPREFQARQLTKVEGALQTHADTIAKRARDVMKTGVNQVQMQWENAIRACSSKDQVKATVAHLGQQGQQAMATVMSQVEQAVAQWSGEAIKELEDPLLEELRERYRIVQQMTGSGMAVQLGRVGATSAATHATNLHAGVNSAVENFEGEQFAFGAGGALAGAAIGTMVFPGIGTAIGAAIGALAGFFKTLDSLKSDCVQEVRKVLGDVKKNLSNQLASLGPDVQRAMQEVLARGLSDAVSRFQSWINQVMTAEREQLDQERQKLSHLIKSRDTLVLHDQSLATLQREAAAVSRGLCA
jgi:hypothetical protein